MKSLSLSKPLVLVVIGVPGSGKSFFARQFSDTFGAPHVSYDQLRHIITPAAIPVKEEQEMIAHFANYQINELFKTQKTFLLDGFGVTRAERAELKKVAHDKGYELLIIWVQTDQATAKYRSMKRSSKKADDLYNPSLTAQQHEQLEKRFSAPAAHETKVVISGKHTYATQARIVLKKLITPREEQLQIKDTAGRAQPQPKPDGQTPRRNVLIR